MRHIRLMVVVYVWFCETYKRVGGNLKKQLTTKNIQENEAISNCKIE